ncbi:MAG TPA: hypothetical protein PKE32_05705, partial [Miltoncostaeaceae bacterium]|nr:hypothetical protein [Miltoncostaeaceae bacterium]
SARPSMSSRPRGPLPLSGGEAFPAVIVTRPGPWVFRPRAARPITIELGIGMWCSSSRWRLVTLHRRPTAGVVPVGEPEFVDGGVIVRVD